MGIRVLLCRALEPNRCLPLGPVSASGHPLRFCCRRQMQARPRTAARTQHRKWSLPLHMMPDRGTSVATELRYPVFVYSLASSRPE